MTRGRCPHRALIAAIEDRYGALDVLVSTMRPWSSATFDGARHRLEFVVAEAVASRMIAEIADAELPIEGGFVADVTIERVAGAIIVTALTIAD